ncbi:hypothetical protein [Actinomadura kijaniata]|uniref:hypothetical protein n=1 Tax=Actinomadura kijaniata TaxID=46161 RepID=UPI0008335E9B|nr:hypothetical protein [Actinomadura kijaniata]
MRTASAPTPVRAAVRATAVAALAAVVWAPLADTSSASPTGLTHADPKATVTIDKVWVPNDTPVSNPRVQLTYSCTSSRPNSLAYTVKQGESYAYGSVDISCPKTSTTVTGVANRLGDSRWDVKKRAEVKAAIGRVDREDDDQLQGPVTGPESLLDTVMGTHTLDACIRSKGDVSTCPMV